MSQTEANKRYIIIGGGIAGVSAAEAIHTVQEDADITLISEERNLPYFRMSLTRYLAGEVEREKLSLHDQQWYLQNHITILLNTHVDAINAETKQITLANGQKLAYDKLILASGAHPNVPPFPGRELKGVQTLRTLEDADLIMDVARQQAKVVCIGGGLLGLEVAGAVARQGAEVTVLEGLDWLLPRQLDAQASVILKKRIEDMGIKVIVPAMTKALQGDGMVENVELADGQMLPADLVLITTGVSANLELAKSAGAGYQPGRAGERAHGDFQSGYPGSRRPDRVPGQKLRSVDTSKEPGNHCRAERSWQRNKLFGRPAFDQAEGPGSGCVQYWSVFAEFGWGPTGGRE